MKFILTFLVTLFAFTNLNADLDIEIPVVDMNDFHNLDKREAFLETLYNAMHEIGFFAVKNTGVDREIIEKAYAQAETFFKKDLATKMQIFIKETGGQRGFVPGEIAKGYQAKDLKEFFHMGRSLPKEELKRLGLLENVWPDQQGFKDAMETLYRELDRYVVTLEEAIIAVINQNSAIKLAANFLNETTKEGDILLRALYYPALAQEQIQQLKQPLYWAAPHTDIDLFAILPHATEKGLQVQMKGEWRTVVVPKDAFVVNVGDMLENMTNGLFISARHRVLALEPDKDRFSMVLFIHPTDETSLAPLPSCIVQTGGIQKYAPGTRKEFLWERLLELNIAPALLEPYSKTGHIERQLQFGRQSPQVVDLLIKNGLASEVLLQAQK